MLDHIINTKADCDWFCFSNSWLQAAPLIEHLLKKIAKT